METESETTETKREDAVPKFQPPQQRTSRLPLVLTLVALLIWFGFQTVELILERRSLTALQGNLEAATQESQKMRAQLEALITRTAELANQGNPGAKKAVEELQKRGIPINAASELSR